MKTAIIVLAVILTLPGVLVWAQDPPCTDEECPPDPGCTDEECPPDPPCTDEDCPCTNGDCPPDDPPCTNGDCPPDDPPCTNGDCPPDDPPCTNGDCPPLCTTDADCAAGEVCDESEAVCKPASANQPPIAQCKDVTVQTSPEGDCSAPAAIDDSSFDPDGDPITLTQSPPGPYSLGATSVTLTVTDDSGAADSCTDIVTVIDAEFPIIYCNSPTTITPPDAPVSFTATASDNCEVNTVAIHNFDCYWYNPAEKRVDKTLSCAVSIAGDTVTIHDTGGVNDNIEWYVTATDTSGNSFSRTCETQIVNPSP